VDLIEVFMHMYENKIMEPVKICFKREDTGTRKSNQFDQSILYASVEASQ
jgi:hypothetical protein